MKKIIFLCLSLAGVWMFSGFADSGAKTVAPGRRQDIEHYGFSSSPEFFPILPLLPGELISDVFSDAAMMVGEFKGEQDIKYVLVVNVSLEKSAKFKLRTPKSAKKIDVISAADGSLVSFDNEAGYWLAAGQGVLIKLSF